MFIKSIKIDKFRGFENVEFELGKQLTVIAGQNGTQKTTVLGLLSHPFSLNSPHAMHGESPLTGGSYRSAFGEKFQLSEQFDTPKSHQWTLNLAPELGDPFTLESMIRDRRKSNEIRFWRKGNRSAGSGYIPLPVIYLSLSRLAPIGEDQKIGLGNDELSPEEFSLYKELHDEILIITDSEMKSASFLLSDQKQTLGANTERYDWKMNSAGQDNVGKIILALLSFARLKMKFPNEYGGGVLAIDELDATLYPGSQLKLINVLRRYASRLALQVLFTTHSLNILEEACNTEADPKQRDLVKVIYLVKADHKIRPMQGPSFQTIQNKLNVTIQAKATRKKLPVYTEDKEAQAFLRVLLKTKVNKVKLVDVAMGHGNYLTLARHKVPGFIAFESLVVLDGDVLNKKANANIVEGLHNFLILPGDGSPEQLIAKYLYRLPEVSQTWEQIHPNYDRQFAFKDFKYALIVKDREIAKDWYKSQKKYWGPNAVRVFALVISELGDEATAFIKKFDDIVAATT
jgi:predicted ATPase